MIDAHIHLEQYDNKSLHDQISKWLEHGVHGVIAVSNDLASSYRTLELQSKYSGFVHAAVGFHPERPLPSQSDFHEWEQLVNKEQANIIAIGEIGLPHYRADLLPDTLEDYLEFFSNCLDIAANVQLPVSLHAVHDKAKLVFQLLRTKKISNAHFHWLKAPEEIVEAIIHAGYFISVTPEVCYRERDQQLLQTIPDNQLLIETDGPWQFGDIFVKTETTPLLLKDILQKVANIKKHPMNYVHTLTVTNTKRCYKLQR